MIIEVKVPVLPESVTEATLMTWNKKVGDFVQREENLIDLETDKVVLELPAPESGVLVEILQENGATVTQEQVIAKIDTSAKASDAKTSDSKPAETEKPATTPNAKASSAPLMPAAAKLAAEQGLTPEQIQGSGRDGRVLKEDLAKSNTTTSSSSANTSSTTASNKTFSSVSVQAPAIQIDGDRPEQRVPMSRLRQRVAQRLLQSQAENAILTTFNEVNMQPVMDLRARYKEQFEKEHGVRLGFMSFFVKAAIAAMKKYPIVNASIDGEDIVYHGYFDIGIAVGSPRGLVVPILRNADQMSLADIEKQIAEFAVKAKDGKLALEDLTGGTFSITNGGTFGSMMSTPIINPPQAAILGMHATKMRAVVEDGQIVARPMMYLALSYDHRLIDGREAVLTLVAIKNALEDPSRLILDL